MTHLLRIRDAEGQTGYDTYIVIPKGMDVAVAVGLVDTAIRKVKSERDDYEWDDLCPLLKGHGFDVNPEITTVNETW